MDDVPTIGHRELRREFENDRHAQALLAMAFEALSDAKRPDPPEIQRVQIPAALRREWFLQENNA